MTANLEPESASIFPYKKPILADKPVPKPRRRLAIGGQNAGIITEEEMGQPKEEVKLEEVQMRKAPSSPSLARKAMMVYRNGTAALLATQMPKMQKIEQKNAQEDLMVKSGIEATAKRPKPTIGEQRVEPRLRRSNTTQTNSSTLKPNKMRENVHPNMRNGASKRKAPTPQSTHQQSTTCLRIPAPPPPLPMKRKIEEEALNGQSPKKDGQNESNKPHLGGKVEGKAQIGVHLQQQQKEKEQSPIPYLTPFCPTASPEATSSFSPSSTATGSSLNSPSPPSPPPPHIFAKSWPSAEEKGSSRNDQMLEELAKEGGAECRLIASWLGKNGREENGGSKNEEEENGMEKKEQQLERPRFLLDRLVPPELQESPPSSNNSSIRVDFTLRRPSARGQCQGTVYVHYHQEKSRLDFSMQNGEGQRGKVPLQSSVPTFSNPMSSHSPSPHRQGVTLLEQLVKSHPIWFLPHLDRQAVGHLLRNQPAGVFIVRASSRSIQSTTQQPNTSPNHLNTPKKSRSIIGGPVMALTIRLPPTTQNDQLDDHLEHFLLESVGPGQSVRLEGSPNIFASLPLLLEHYSQLEALQELKCRLRLPEAIARSDSIQTLQGLALMGQDFWTSPLSTALSGSAANSPEVTIVSLSSHSQCQSPTSSSLRSGPLPPMPPHPPPMSTFQLHHQFQHRPLQPAYCQSPSPSMATTVDGVVEDRFESTYHNHQRHPIMIQKGGGGCCCYCAGCPAHHSQSQHFYQYQQFPPLRKSHSVQSSFTPAAGNPSNGSSIRHPWCQSPGSQSLNEGRKLPQSKQKDGFLRSIFSPSPSRRKQSSSSGIESPLWEEPAEVQIWNGQKRRANNKKGGQNGQSQSIFARLKGKNNPFWRTNSSAGMGVKDDWQATTNSNMSSEMLWARQAAFRRTNTDMGGCGMAAALGRMRAAPTTNGPLPQLARVLPQPRREFPIIMNGNSPLQGQIAAPPADIRKNSFQKSRWQQQSPQHSSDSTPIGLQRIQQRIMTDSVGGGQQNVATFKLSNGSQQGRSQAIVATVRPQQKMMPIMAKQSREEQSEKVKNGGDPSEYTHLYELKSAEGEWEGGRRSFGSKNGDELSLAGTDFNEPWDSNAWENLLDLARFGDTKAEIPLLTEQPKRRSCSTSSSGSTWRRSSQSSSTEAEDEENLGQSPKEKIEEETSADEMATATEEALAMAMILAGNGTLPNSRKKPRTEEWGEGEENDPKLSLARTHQNPSMDTLILIEQAAKAANSSRGLQRSRWTRATSSSLIDMTKPSVDNGRMVLRPDRPFVEEDGKEMAAESSNEYDPFNACSMDQLNNHFKFKNPPAFRQHSTITTTSSFNRMDDENWHRRSERRIRAMMEKSIEEISSPTFNKTMNVPDTQNEASKCEEKMSSGIAQFNSTPTIHHHHHQQNGAVAYSSSMDELSHHSRSGSICPSITPILSPSRFRNASQDHPGEEDPVNIIQRYVENLSVDDKTVFGATLQRFIECTLLSREQDPYVVIRRVRQFLNGIKNYLVGNGEGDLDAVIARESDRLHPDEFLNIDAILEAVLNKILLVRIKSQLYRLMLLESTRNGELGKLSENLAAVRAMNSTELGFPEGTPMPDTIRMEQISKQMRKMQNHYSPLKKLQLLLRTLAMAVPHLSLLSSSELRHQQAQQSNSSILVSSQSFSDPRFRTNSGSSSNGTAMAAALKHPPADELIRWLVYLLARCSTINCEIEAWYMWELLPQQVLSTGDAAYFLSILFSAVYVLKHPENIHRLKNISLPANHHLLPNIADFLGSQSTLHGQEETSSDLLLRVAIPNEQEGSIEYHTFPVLPQMNAAKLCRIIAHQFSVSNPEDYGLYLIFEGGHETPLNANELPHLIRDQMLHSVRHHLFVYKRSGARIAWRPKFTNSHTSTIAAAHIPHQQH